MRGSPFFVRPRRISVSDASVRCGFGRRRVMVGFTVGLMVGSAVGFEVVFPTGATAPRPCADRAALFRNRIILYIIA